MYCLSATLQYIINSVNNINKSISAVTTRAIHFLLELMHGRQVSQSDMYG